MSASYGAGEACASEVRRRGGRGELGAPTSLMLVERFMRRRVLSCRAFRGRVSCAGVPSELRTKERARSRIPPGPGAAAKCCRGRRRGWPSPPRDRTADLVKHRQLDRDTLAHGDLFPPATRDSPGGPNERVFLINQESFLYHPRELSQSTKGAFSILGGARRGAAGRRRQRANGRADLQRAARRGLRRTCICRTR